MLHLYWFNDSVPTGGLHVPRFQPRAELNSTAVMVGLQESDWEHTRSRTRKRA